MRLATIRTGDGHRAVRIDSDRAVETGDPDLRALLDHPDWADRAAAASGREHPLTGLDFAPLVPAPEKIICVGRNYHDHAREMGGDAPEFPTVFAKFPPALIGAHDEIVLPKVSEQVDYEAELTVVIGAPVRHATPEQAAAAIAGYTVLNDVSMRDWQRRTTQFLQGKTFEQSTPIGPWLVTPDELPPARPGISPGIRPGISPGISTEISTVLDGEIMQHASTEQMIFSPVELICYLSQIVTLNPGDVIATGTPGGVGHARKPPRYLTDGALLVTSVAGIGELRNICRLEK